MDEKMIHHKTCPVCGLSYVIRTDARDPGEEAQEIWKKIRPLVKVSGAPLLDDEVNRLVRAMNQILKV